MVGMVSMTTIRKTHVFALTLLILSVVTITTFMIPYTRSNSTNSFNTMDIPAGNTNSFYTNEEYYRADLNWIKTLIEIDEQGMGKVTVHVNCTPAEDHIGMYLTPLEQNEPVEVILSECHALNHGQELAVNCTGIFDDYYSYKLYIEDISSLYTNESILYQFTYTADFYLSDQISIYTVDPSLTVIDVKRPLWQGDLEYQELEIILPINVGQSDITADFLSESRFSVEQFMIDFYNMTNTTTSDGSGNHWFTFTSRKNDLLAKAPFQARFYLAEGYFSLPNSFNWVVILLTSTFTLIALGLFLVVITVKNESKEEVSKFKEQLYDILKDADADSEK